MLSSTPSIQALGSSPSRVSLLIYIAIAIDVHALMPSRHPLYLTPAPTTYIM